MTGIDLTGIPFAEPCSFHLRHEYRGIPAGKWQKIGKFQFEKWYHNTTSLIWFAMNHHEHLKGEIYFKVPKGATSPSFRSRGSACELILNIPKCKANRIGMTSDICNSHAISRTVAQRPVKMANEVLVLWTWGHPNHFSLKYLMSCVLKRKDEASHPYNKVKNAGVRMAAAGDEMQNCFALVSFLWVDPDSNECSDIGNNVRRTELMRISIRRDCIRFFLKCYWFPLAWRQAGTVAAPFRRPIVIVRNRCNRTSNA
jgi:hypothetical protein